MLSISQGEKLPPKLAVKASLKLKKAAVQAPVIDNADGFFDQLARISGKGQRAKQQLQLTKANKGIEHQPREDWRRA